MGFKRVWDSTCPRVWDTWESHGRKWVIQDLDPKDDEKAVQILLYQLASDEPLCIESGVLNDPESAEGMSDVWRRYISERTTIACYTDIEGKKTLVGLNCVKIACKGEVPDLENVFDAMMMMETKVDAFEYLGTDKLLTALGLVMAREFRGMKIGCRLLNAREALCRHIGVEGSETVFTAPSSQRLAALCGYTTLAVMTWSELADAGLAYSRCDDKVLKFMVKKYE